MGRRSRKRRVAPPKAAPPPEREPAAKAAPPDAAPAASGDEALRRGYARSREREEEVRSGLEPLAPGERPWPVTIAAIVAFVFAIANGIATLTGNDINGADNATTQSLVQTAILVIAGAGMLARKYWAVLGFQAILVFQILVLCLALVRVEKWWVGVGSALLIGFLGWLFYKLIRAMARLQMPTRPDADRPAEGTR